MKLPTKRRWMQFSLRSFLLVMTVAALLLTVPLNRARARREAIRAIDELGGTYGVEIMGPKWLREWVDDSKYFYDAIRVSFGPHNQGYDPRRPFTDDELERVIEHLNAFPGFKNLRLMGSEVTDDGLRQLSRLRNLEDIRLDGMDVTDNGLEHLAEIKTLRLVSVLGTKVTADGVAKLKPSLPNCTITH